MKKKEKIELIKYIAKIFFLSVVLASFVGVMLASGTIITVNVMGIQIPTSQEFLFIQIFWCWFIMWLLLHEEFINDLKDKFNLFGGKDKSTETSTNSNVYEVPMNNENLVKIELISLVVKEQIKGYGLYINNYYVVFYAVENGDAILDRSKYYLIESFVRALDPTFEKEITYEEEGYEFNHEDPEDVRLLYNYLHKALVKYYLNERAEIDG